MSTILQEYMKNGMLGAYHPESAMKKELDGKVFPQYRDTHYADTGDGLELKREMIVGGRAFLVRSIFPSAPTKTPTQQILSIIDHDMKNK